MTILRSTPEVRNPEPGQVVEVRTNDGPWRLGQIDMYGSWYVRHMTDEKTWWRSNPPTEWRERKET